MALLMTLGHGVNGQGLEALTLESDVDQADHLLPARSLN